MTAPRRRLLSLLTVALLSLGLLGAAPAGGGLLGTGLLDVGLLDAGGGEWTLGGERCQLIDVPAASPVGVLGSCPGVRPGAAVRTDAGMCTFNYLFAAPNGEGYIGTAGHCIFGDEAVPDQATEVVWPKDQGPEAFDGQGEKVGEFVYAVLEDPRDFALIRLDEGVDADPQMCHFGGPTGLFDGTVDGELLTYEHYGQGLVLGSLVPGRTAVSYGAPDPDHIFVEGVALPGDSGSPINLAGLAAGVIVTVGLHSQSIGTGAIDAGLVGVTRLAPQLERAEQMLGVDLTLQTAERL